METLFHLTWSGVFALCFPGIIVINRILSQQNFPPKQKQPVNNWPIGRGHKFSFKKERGERSSKRLGLQNWWVHTCTDYWKHPLSFFQPLLSQDFSPEGWISLSLSLFHIHQPSSFSTRVFQRLLIVKMHISSMENHLTENIIRNKNTILYFRIILIPF